MGFNVEMFVSRNHGKHYLGFMTLSLMGLPWHGNIFIVGWVFMTAANMFVGAYILPLCSLMRHAKL